jgi:hypothetical protein
MIHLDEIDEYLLNIDGVDWWRLLDEIIDKSEEVRRNRWWKKFHRQCFLDNIMYAAKTRAIT